MCEINATDYLLGHGFGHCDSGRCRNSRGDRHGVSHRLCDSLNRIITIALVVAVITLVVIVMTVADLYGQILQLKCTDNI